MNKTGRNLNVAKQHDRADRTDIRVPKITLKDYFPKNKRGSEEKIAGLR